MKFKDMAPRDNLNQQEVADGLRYTIRDGITTQIMVTATEGIFLISFALLLGASNTIIGILAAIPFLSQLGQIAGIYLLEKIKIRKKVVMIMVFASRIFLVLIALIPILTSGELGLLLLAGFLILRNVTGSIAGVSWNSWMRDLIPINQMGSFFAKRMRLASVVGTVLLLLFSYFLDVWAGRFPEIEIYGYSILFFLGFIAGMVGLFFLYRTPEPRMMETAPRPIGEIFQQPFADGEFRPLLVFLLLWNFAVNMAAPFFVVYMLSQLQLPISVITLFLVLTQVFNIFFLRIWGSLSERISYKTILVLCTPVFILTFPLWTFTTLPGMYFLTYPLLIVIHILLGITISGITLSVGTIAMKLAPQEASGSYLATAGMTNSLAAGIGTIAGGILADFFADKTLIISLQWISDRSTSITPAINLQSWDFVFIIAFVLGLIAVERLTAVKESGTVPRKDALNEFFNEVRCETRRFSTIAGLTRISQVPILNRRRRRRQKREVPAKSGNEEHMIEFD